MVSAGTIQPLRNNRIPSITLIHEFSAYIRPISSLRNVGLWSSKLVFSSPLTKEDLLNECKVLHKLQCEVIPQGQCKRPKESKTKINKNDNAWNFHNCLKHRDILILGAGQIQPRKGVDIFIAVASKINKLCPDSKIKFAWIGSGYDPENDFNVSLWLRDQIKRSGLTGQLTILNHSSAYDSLMKRANCFLITSRLDPLPNERLNDSRKTYFMF